MTEWQWKVIMALVRTIIRNKHQFMIEIHDDDILMEAWERDKNTPNSK